MAGCCGHYLNQLPSFTADPLRRHPCPPLQPSFIAQHPPCHLSVLLQPSRVSHLPPSHHSCTTSLILPSSPPGDGARDSTLRCYARLLEPCASLLLGTCSHHLQEPRRRPGHRIRVACVCAAHLARHLHLAAHHDRRQRYRRLGRLALLSGVLDAFLQRVGGGGVCGEWCVRV